MKKIVCGDKGRVDWKSSCVPIYPRAMNALARTTSPVDRLHDALVSLRFLIEVDVMAQSLDDVLFLSFG